MRKNLDRMLAIIDNISNERQDMKNLDSEGAL
jgi:hypothetical protein